MMLNVATTCLSFPPSPPSRLPIPARRYPPYTTLKTRKALPVSAKKKSGSPRPDLRRPPCPPNSMLRPNVIASAPGCEKKVQSGPGHLAMPANIEKRGSRGKGGSCYILHCADFFFADTGLDCLICRWRMGTVNISQHPVNIQSTSSQHPFNIPKNHQ